ncbi:MAG: hypothetical protein QG656_1381 [Candidatus Hydrogenedentes bacterium]|nr:hypothetical protein [Candidatus Hydrogenedentota bacterium]
MEGIALHGLVVCGLRSTVRGGDTGYEEDSLYPLERNVVETETGNRDKPLHAVRAEDRIMCVDVLRGFDMFWLVGGAGLALGMFRVCGGKIAEALALQLEHVEWIGFRFYDLIFPLFVFVVGMSVVFSVGAVVERDGKAAAYKRILRRAVLMYLLGILYYGGMNQPWAEIRWMGVLQRLALCYLFTGILYCHLRTRGLVVVCAALLVGYWAWLAFIPVPGQDVVSWTKDIHWPGYIDEQFLPGRKHNGAWDPEGILSTFPAIASCLLGVFAAQILVSKAIPQNRKLILFLVGGAALAAAGYAWGLHFPVIKKIWTSSFVLVAGGYSAMLLGLFYLVVDVWKVRWWTAPFVWIGMNPLTIYMTRNFLDFNELAKRFIGGSLSGAVSEDAAYFLQVTASLALSLIFVRFLYRKKIFLRV